MIKDKINSLQLSSMMMMLMVASFLGIGMFSIIKSAGVDAYISILIGGIAGIFVLLTFFVIFDYEPNLSIGDKFKNVFGKKIGTVLNLITLLIVITLGISAMFNLTTFITSQFLPETPAWIIGVAFSLVVILINIKGLETLSRTCLILLIICIILFLGSMIGLIPEFQLSNLKPYLEYGFKRPLIGAFYNFSFNIIPIYFLLVVPKNSLVNKEKYKKYIWIFYVASVAFKFILMLMTMGVLGIHLASIYQYPEYIVLKRINLFDFIDRIENIITIQWLFGLFFNMSFVVYYISNSLKFANKSKLLPIILQAIIFFESLFLFKNNTNFNDYTYTKVPIVRLSLLFIYILLFIMILIKKKKKTFVN